WGSQLNVVLSGQGVFIMAVMTGAEAMYEMMVREGVRYIFGNPGTTELPLMDMFAARDEVEYILALHEDSALGMACGYADATGRAAVVNLHTNPGLAHALGNLYNAYRAGTPLVVTAGQQDSRALIDEPLLTADMIELARQHTKWAWEIRHASEIPACLARAFKIAETPPTGPVFISLPVDTMEASADIELPGVTRVAWRMRGDRESIRKAALLLASSRNPAIIAGDGCARSGATSALTTFAEKIAARVYAEPLNSLLSFPTDHPLYAGPLFANAKQTRAQLEGTDTILIIGANNLAPLVYTGQRMLPPESRLIQINADDRELGKNFPAEVAIQADPRSALEDLIEAFEALANDEIDAGISHRRDLLTARIAEARAKFVEQATVIDEGGLMSPGFVAREMRRAAPRNTVLVDESVTSTAFVRTLFDLDEPNTYFYAKGGSLGLGLPSAVGVKLAMADRPVVCAVGDGSALYSIQALWTSARYRLAVKFVVFNNTSYMILKGGLLAFQGAAMKRGVFPGMDLTEPEIDFVRLAESFGVAARRVAAQTELRPALDWAFEHEGPVLLDVLIARDVRSVLR
ncbi:MAG TPA: thiamine pyrophosphate-binding protein, partial [Blastocatellia bacterium]|nr:thiamine pyrophosphate-binding protein [Blastocatellia bacterium]